MTQPDPRAARASRWRDLRGVAGARRRRCGRAAARRRPRRWCSRARRRSRTSVLKVKLPRPQEADLANGLHLIVLEDHRLPQITFQIIIPGAGGYYDPRGQGRPRELHRAADARRHEDAHVAADLAGARDDGGDPQRRRAACRPRRRRSRAAALTENFDKLMDLAADVLLNPSFPPAEWDRLKTRTKAGLVQQRAESRVSSRPRCSTAWSSARIRRRACRRRRPTLDAITREALVEFHRARYVPDHAAIAFAGDISLAEARKLVERSSAAGRRRARRADGRPIRPPLGAPKVYLDRAARLGADDADRRHAVDDPHRSRLRGADRGEPRPRRRRWAACSGICAKRRATRTASAAHSRRTQYRAPGRRRRACAPR